MTLNPPIKTCRICLNPIRIRNYYHIFNPNELMCSKCLKKLRGKFHEFHVGPYKALSIYDYNEDLRSLLYQLKGCGDFELANLLLFNYKSYLKFMIPPSIIIPAPSYYLDDEERGFNHVEEIFKCLGYPIMKIIEKTERHKQSDQTKGNRKEIRKYLRLKNKPEIAGKNILVVDDVFTTGSTIKSMVKLIEPLHPKTIRILVLSKTMYKPKV